MFLAAPTGILRASARSIVQYAGPVMLSADVIPERAGGRIGERGRIQVVVQRPVAVRVVEELVDALCADADERDVAGGRHGEETPRTRVEDA